MQHMPILRKRSVASYFAMHWYWSSLRCSSVLCGYESLCQITLVLLRCGDGDVCAGNCVVVGWRHVHG